MVKFQLDSSHILTQYVWNIYLDGVWNWKPFFCAFVDVFWFIVLKNLQKLSKNLDTA